ncbi:putative cytochrome P450 6a13 [Amphibalanus amphitrite]|uniref:Putative cytochrome P450 6a13 n=1 Tax=Amphibalanus amphitrite TaxID=1232801 RepID=A0A6A4VZ13_AMPAM|nr:probable cytochrome P450 6a13 [Amphibalanus amphitrite]KAF0294711.1 putative cytochrome P450 6a13 [Amphibalanus amphitrite]
MIGTLLGVLSAVLKWVFTPLPLAVLACTMATIYYLMTKDYRFWKARGVPGPTPTFPYGNEFGPPLVDFIGFEEWIYNTQGGKKFCGYIEMARPVLYVGDLDLIRAITIKDFESFTDRRDLAISEDFMEMLQVLNGKEWKDTRSVMSPTFSSSKLRAMHQLCLDNASNLNDYVKAEMKRTGGEIDIKDCFGRFTMDNIASCAFGVNCNSFKDPNTEFAKNAAVLFEAPTGFAAVRLTLLVLLGNIVQKILPDPLKSVNQFFARVVNRTINERQTGDRRKDFLQLLLDTKDKDGKRILTDSSIIAQSVLFFIVGYDTTAKLLTFAAYCLATNPEVQDGILSEIDEVLERHKGQLTYEALGEMHQLDRAISETLRLYPPAARIERLSSKEYTLPGTNVTIPKGTVVQMPIFTLHRDPDHYPDPMRFDPDRFLPEEKEKRHPCAYIPFGSGPRNCIAMRFALFEAKVALAAMLRETRLEPGPNTPKPPMPLDKRAFLLTPEGNKAFLRAVPRK